MAQEFKPLGGLHLCRKQGESIFLFVNGVQIQIAVKEIRGTNVTLTVAADPKKVAVLRGEMLKESK